MLVRLPPDIDAMANRRDIRRGDRRRPATPASAFAPPPLSRLDAQQLAEVARQEGRTVALRVLTNDTEPAPASKAAAAARDVALRLVRQAPLSQRHACRAGCAFCCHTSVTSAPTEALDILQYLRENASAQQLADVRDRTAENAARAKGLFRAKYAAALVPCALLTTDGQCLVHPVRPLACAGHMSFSREACEAEFNRVPGRSAVPVDRQAMIGVLGVAHGLRDACQSVKRDGESYELHNALLRLWDMRDAAQQWSTGAELMQGCLRADAW